ncbi:MAG: Proline--tRNA ligase [Syntrophomonadaceae bacterium]|nr:Proline--tRNA ligase [Bacillota bacterium]
MIFSKEFFPTHRLVDKSDGFSVLEAAAYVKVVSPGCITLLPFGVLVMRNIAENIRRIASQHGFFEVALPLIQKRELWEESGRAFKYPGLLCETTIGNEKRYVINPTQEEAVLDLFRLSNLKIDALPLRLFQVGERVRNEIRPAHGLIRSRCFTLADFYALCRDEIEMEEAAQVLEQIMTKVVKWAGLPVQKGMYYPSTMGVPTYSYWTPSETKQCILVVCRICDVSYRSSNLLVLCPTCGSRDLDSVKAVEIGDVMRSGIALSESMSVTAINTQTPIHVAMAGIGVSRLLQLMAEYYHDKNGLSWPIRMAPFVVELIAIPEREKEAHDLYIELSKAGYPSLLDLRNLSLGRRLIDGDLFGIPIRVILGNKTFRGSFDVKERRTGYEKEMGREGLFNLINQINRKETECYE